MKTSKHTRFYTSMFILLPLGLILGCNSQKEKKSTTTETKKELSFRSNMIADSLALLWAHDPEDLDGDGLKDLVFISDNGRGGHLGYYKGQTSSGLWEKIIIAETAPNGLTFALGDLECADIDFDGDIDVVAAEHTGEWDSSAYPSTLYWFENPSWTPHLIGEVAEFIKDVSLTDFNNDSKMDIALLTFENSTLTVLQQQSADRWEKVLALSDYGNLHEGMDVGDINGDGLTDILADAHIFYNPGSDLKNEWRTENLDEKWNTQTGDWSRNGTKAFLRDINGDGRSEIFISHSERAGYPISMYRWNKSGTWEILNIADSLPACHTLQVFDFDLDGDFDVLAGVNQSRAVGLGIDEFPVTVYLSSNNYQDWESKTIETNGVYNGQAADLENDGDFDIFRYPTHDAKAFYVLVNEMRN